MNKRIQIVVLALIIIGTVAACDWDKSTTIVNKTDNFYQKIKYSGKVVFTENAKGIEYISDHGYLEFEQNGRRFKAKDNGKGRIGYEFDGGSQVTDLNLEQKEFIARAVQSIVKERKKSKPE
ncbi:hypothetical protein EWM62_04755 [Mucilaginibacter terrigena]|uniref:Lipoprotein n=1 Tax=Mucilaginibacter terrigena TaxID=2492395 RepID=A0A4Q5LPF0_9SPHI|nr:hypothetical protein [Mucilaginibacter terrigena]RYU91253.1 hypothetical protein EWM62_04755 [Mucilaginibacter terrigena]